MYAARYKKKYSKANSLKSLQFCGYTIIEVLIVIVTMFLIFSVGTAGYRSFQRRRVLDGAANQIKSHLRLAQQMTISGVKPATCPTLISITFGVSTTPSSTYSISGDCVSGASEISVVIKSFNFEPDYPGIKIYGSSVVFNMLGKGVAANQTLTLTQDGTVDTRTISINEGGAIN